MGEIGGLDLGGSSSSSESDESEELDSSLGLAAGLAWDGLPVGTERGLAGDVWAGDGPAGFAGADSGFFTAGLVAIGFLGLALIASLSMSESESESELLLLSSSPVLAGGGSSGSSSESESSLESSELLSSSLSLGFISCLDFPSGFEAPVFLAAISTG